jgi:hypothetical protein
MIPGRELVAIVQQAGITHLPWIPDSELGRWEADLVAAGTPRLIRVCREGEALALAAGLLLGGANPLVLMQCTGLFEAGDALRNVVHDLGLPVRAIIGVRSWIASQNGGTRDTCPRFLVPYVEAWQLPYRWLDGTAADLASALGEPGPRLFLLPE